MHAKMLMDLRDETRCPSPSDRSDQYFIQAYATAANNPSFFEKSGHQAYEKQLTF